MYEFPLTIGLIPNLGGEAAAIASALSVIGAIWLGVSAVLLVVVALAARGSEAPDVLVDAERWDADLRRAA
jgi:hypothetical protein